MRLYYTFDEALYDDVRDLENVVTAEVRNVYLARDVRVLASECLAWIEVVAAMPNHRRAPASSPLMQLKHQLQQLTKQAPAQETSVPRCTCNDFPGADQFCTAHKAPHVCKADELQPGLCEACGNSMPETPAAPSNEGSVTCRSLR